MKIRAVTVGFNFGSPVPDAPAFERAGTLLRQAVARFVDAGLDVQTTRLAGTPTEIGDDAVFEDWTGRCARAARDVGVEYLALGRIPSQRATLVEHHLPGVLAAHAGVFASADLLSEGRPSIPMARACARAVRRLAERTEHGFGNLRFAATAGCPPNIPFFPAAYHAGGPPRFALAVEAADVVLGVLRRPGSTAELEQMLVQAFDDALAPVERVAVALGEQLDCPFDGIDLSPAPFPSAEVSIGSAIEGAGVDRFGAPGTLFVAALVTRALRRTHLRRTGFSGLMLPVLEDGTLAARLSEHPRDLHALLLYSAVCGTGLDTVPLPGDVSEAELAGVFLDVAALSAALSKPLTARLLPVPGASSGEMTSFDFPYFANGRVLPAQGAGAQGLIERGA
ncbi:MAG: DUF711 family protein [Chloroflexi bacterium]|nr:DUF711 family protein [Chloroflexota bacterium]